MRLAVERLASGGGGEPLRGNRRGWGRGLSLDCQNQAGTETVDELDTLMDLIRRKYEVEVVPLKIGDRTLQLLQLTDFEAYIERLVDSGGVSIMDLPFWAKVWESSFLMAYFLGRQPVVPGQRLLEIGAGMGVVGLYAALCGHRVTLSDINEDALLFARANARLNGLTEMNILKLDWNDPSPFEPYDIVFGSEVIYDRKSYPLLVRFLRRAVAPDGMIFLAKNQGLHAPRFFEELTRYFEFKEKVQEIRSCGEAEKICLYAIRRKRSVPGESGVDSAARADGGGS